MDARPANIVPKISVVHPSRMRADMCSQTIYRWISGCSDYHNLEYIVSLDADDPQLSLYEERLKARFPDIKIVINPNISAIQAINIAAKETTGNIIIVVSDDFDCPMYWDKFLLDTLEGKEDYLLKTWDGIQKFIVTLPIMDRKYYYRFGYIYQPSYLHMFTDTEMSVVGHMLGRTLYSDLYFPHRHYIVGGMRRDLINAKNDATWEQGKEVFYRRKSTNFDLKADEIVNQFPEDKI